MPTRSRQPLTILSVLAWSCSAAAQDRHSDFQIWNSASGIVAVGSHAEARIDGLVQVTDDVSHVGRVLVRGVVLVKLNDSVKLGGGYLWTEVEPSPGIHLTEHRGVQELDVHTPLRHDGFSLSLRTMMEERWREQQDGMSLRWRQLTRLDIPLAPKKLALVFWDEYFHEFKSTTWSGRAGPSLMINFVGLHLPLGSRIAIEPGYLNQTQFDIGPNRVRHAFAIYGTAHF